MKTSRTILSIIIPSIIFSLTGCNNNDSYYTAQFVDSPVQGLEFSCVNGDIGLTGKNGLFKLSDNTVCTFKIGDLVLGTASVSKDSSIITPYSLSNDKQKIVNIATLLQNLDIDNNLNNGITLPKNDLYLPQSLLTSSNETSFRSQLQEVVPDLGTYINQNSALNHLNQTINMLPDSAKDLITIIQPDSDNVIDDGNTTNPDHDNSDINKPDHNTSQPSTSINAIPTLNKIELGSITSGQKFSYQVIVHDVENDLLTYSLVNAPSWLKINSSTGLMSGTPTDHDLEPTTFKVVVSDGHGAVSQTINIDVIQSIPSSSINAIPSISDITLGTVIANKPFTYQVTAHDAENDPLTYSLVNAPSWLTINPSTGLMSGTPTDHDLEPVTFKVVVSDGHGSVSQTINIDVIKVLPPTNLEPALQKHIGIIMSSGLQLTGDISCNGTELTTSGTFEFWDREPVQCSYGSISLFSADGLEPKPIGEPVENVIQFDLKDFLNKNAVSNTTKILNKIDECKEDSKKICLDELNSYDIESLYGSTNNTAVNEFLNPSSMDETEEIGKAPSSHVDVTLKPEVASGTSTDLTSKFVSAAAESTYEYKPSADAQTITTSVLTDEHGIPLSGISYYSPSSRGTTNNDGSFEYRWGEPITFGIDTFSFGSVKGNQVEYKLSDVSENPVIKQNIQSLITRYGVKDGQHIDFGTKIHQVFSLYPNSINKLIDLSLPNGAKIGNTEYKLPNEFEDQFSSGLTKDIDDQLKQLDAQLFVMNDSPNIGDNNNSINATLKKLYNGVNLFHIFNDTGSYYGASGYARLMRNLNISNKAYPALMPRTDSSYWLPFKVDQAWTREKKPFVVDATTIDASSTVKMKRPTKVSKDNATFGLPGISIGAIGSGKVVFVGNANYPIILSCPDSYWADKSLAISNGVCRYNVKVDGKPADPKDSTQYDHGSMQKFFKNLFTMLNPSYNNAKSNITIGTNITQTPKFDHGHQGWIPKYDFFIDNSYNVTLEHISSGGFDNLDPATTPILLLQSFEIDPIKIWNGYEDRSNVEKPKLTNEDVTALIQYVNAGGNIVFFDAISELNPEPIAKLADTAGISLGGENVAASTTTQSYCGSSYYCHGSGVAPNVHTVTTKDLVVYERFTTINDESTKIHINSDGTVDWPKKMPKLEVAKYTTEVNKKPQTHYAFFEVSNDAEKKQAIDTIKGEFPGVQECKDSYEYEVNCIEFRKGHGIPTYGTYHRTPYERYSMSPDVVDSMVQAANLGSNLDKLYSHELYYRTKGNDGKRLSLSELNQTYDNVSVWLWNDENYRYEASHGNDELGFKTAVEYLNCYTNNKHGGGSSCNSEKLKALKNNHFLLEDGELNPSYPLNYQEKPLTRIMLGRSYWDNDITVDTTKYPGRPLSSTAGSETVDITTYTHPVIGTASNMQSTGLWAPQHQEVTITGGIPASISVALVDNLTGREKHDVALQRPPRVQKNYAYNGTSLTFKVPYGGLIYIKPRGNSINKEDTVQFNINGVERASFWKDGNWKYPVNTDIPLAEIDTGSFVYTTPVKNVANLSEQEMQKFVDDLNFFAKSASAFYGRDETTVDGKHRRFTYDGLPNHRHRFVNDVEISIGAAHSGYPVMSTTYSPKSTKIPTTPRNNWLIWHEVGHNLASAPFNVTGATEVANNILALYMQEQREAPNNKMSRVEADIQKMPILISRDNGHIWSEGNAGIRLVMFAQLKLWAANHFKIDDWYKNGGSKPTVYGQDEGWNMFKLMHRKSRGDIIGDSDRGNKNYCSSAETGLTDGNLLMVCSSYVSGYDLSSFFETWNPSESMNELPNGSKLYRGGITSTGRAVLHEIKGLKQPTDKPEDINSL
ncbi:SslE/AcfD family lipoprotein zinc metalloprotease [Photobacterium damselae]|uniref:SslE/AcfD family lipoprotein zinc metalloprotease n=1 Tax=Photobacterium damselae TaxID=38293 RepID=UPI001EFE59D1|nr:SslE/AcfD family lipoprotein zinc metalloprotease [Photobacterium damselae]MCG9780353.1 SslE/AcfD family lipoprotein zinc metalloprotease [Photobacterium damselae]